MNGLLDLAPPQRSSTRLYDTPFALRANRPPGLSEKIVLCRIKKEKGKYFLLIIVLESDRKRYQVIESFGE